MRHVGSRQIEYMIVQAAGALRGPEMLDSLRLLEFWKGHGLRPLESRKSHACYSREFRVEVAVHGLPQTRQLIHQNDSADGDRSDVAANDAEAVSDGDEQHARKGQRPEDHVERACHGCKP